MIEQYSAAGDSRIGAPVRPIGRDGDCRLRAQGLPANCPHGADRAFIDERRNPVANRRLEPVVHGMNDAAAARRGRRNGLRILYLRGQRLFTKDMEALHPARA
jgi:hypothetical protein